MNDMITLCVLETRMKEDKLYLKLLSRGRQADVPYYFSVVSHNWNEGRIEFARLDCAPAPSFKVGVAGNQLVVIRRYASMVSGWLKGWNIGYKITEEKNFQTKPGALKFFGELRKKSMSKKERERAGKRFRIAKAKIDKQEAEASIGEQESFEKLGPRAQLANRNWR